MSKQFEKDQLSPHQALFNALRTLLLSRQGMVETQKPRITTYSDSNGGICHMRTTASGVDMGYLKGALFNDKLKLLSGSSKKMRVHHLPASKVVDFAAVEYYLDQAQRCNSAKC